jgi:mono/diheme cytochrome c family protein
MSTSEESVATGRRNGYTQLWCGVLTLLLTCATNAAELSVELSVELRPALGKIADPQNTIVSRDGSGLPLGQSTAMLGQSLYAAKCAACHGMDGKQAGNALVGGQGSLATAGPNKTVGSYWPYATTLFDYINRAMPFDQPKSLSADEVYGVVAYVLYLNDIAGRDQILSQANLAQVVMPNSQGFVELPVSP